MQRILSLNAEDFKLGGRGHTELREGAGAFGPRPVSLKIECAKPLLGLAGQLLYVY